MRLPVAAAEEGFGFAEIARRHGDFALAGVATRVRLRGDGPEAVITGFGVSDRAVTRDVSEQLTAAVTGTGSAPADRLKGALSAVVEEMVDTDGDAHASRNYRRRLLRTLAARELSKAYERAHKGVDEVAI
ncbi:hypothetical protein ACFYOY_34025 [Streptomyces sp. NPDC007875]|uniref:hypothetical protein n=1 Tax=Streptomyces sp. NPDC007875 TaxID=3364783 RepID=UPI0036B44199